MTDDQVQQIVEALLPEWWEPWLSAAVTLLAVLAGWGLATVSERRARRERKRDQDAEGVAQAVRRAGVVLGQYATAPSQVIVEQLKAVHLASPEVAHDLNRFDGTGTVAGWWLRQMSKLMSMEAASPVPPGAPLDPVIGERTLIMTSVDARLQGWARGEVPVKEFEPQFDAAWDAMIRERHAPGPREN